MEELIKATAQTSLDIWVYCPYCNNYQDETERLKEDLQEDLRANNLDVEVECEECEKLFIVTEITY